jgi:diadenylate cyclase
MILDFQSFFSENYHYLIEGYLIFIVILVALQFIFKSKLALKLSSLYLVIAGIALVCFIFKFDLAYKIYRYLLVVYPFAMFIILLPDIRKQLDGIHKLDKMDMLASSVHTRNEIADACVYLSSKKIGALITIEKNNSLDQYASKAIELDSSVTKELLINIFTPYTPLHDGAVIVRGNRIRCAGAYYVLTEHEGLDKTMGSRHRAGLGISEVSDSLTIICSEETGKMSIAIDGMMIPIPDKDKLMEYLELFLK